MFFTVQIILVILILALIAAITFIVSKLLPFRPKLDPVKTLHLMKVIKVTDGHYRKIMHHRNIIHKKWEKLVEEKIKKGNENDLRLAIIEADTLIDEVLKEHNYPGNDMGERLKSIHPYEYKCLDDLWRAHKIRNRIAHDSDFHLTIEESKEVLAVYHQALEELLSKELELI